MEQKKLIVPETNKLQISGFHDVRYFMFMAKIYLKKFKEVELHALGEAISTCVRTADALKKQQLIAIEKISTFAFNPDKKEGQTETGEEGKMERKKIKMVIKVQRSVDFLEKTKNID